MTHRNLHIRLQLFRHEREVKCNRLVVQSPALCAASAIRSAGRCAPTGFLGYIQIRPSCRTALSDYCEIVSMLLSTPEANHTVVPRRDIFELVARKHEESVASWANGTTLPDFIIIE